MKGFAHGAQERAALRRGGAAWMISVHGTRSSKDEYEAALALRDAILSEYPQLDSDDNHVALIVSAKTPENRRAKDIDIVLLALFSNPLIIPSANGGDEVAIGSLAATIEVKNHRPGDVRVRDNKLEVRYKNEWADAWEQADRQKFALGERVESITGKRPFVTGLVWMRQVTAEALLQAGAREPHPFLPHRFTFSDFCRRMLALDPPYRQSDGRLTYRVLPRAFDMSAIIKALVHEEVLSEIDRQRIEEICKREVAKQRFEDLGTAQYVITGPGGTGKTVYILRLAQRLYEEGQRVLVLTYNIALVTDLSRQLRYIGLRDDSSERAVRVQTLHAFFIDVLVAFDIIAPSEVSELWFNTDYPKAMASLKRFLQQSKQDDIDAIVARHLSTLGWHYVCVDEGQDWSDDERDVLHLLYGANHCLIADGKDQLVRQQAPCIWKTDAAGIKTDVIQLRKSLRMKNRLATFANRFAQHIGVPGWEVEPEPESVGGNVVILLTPPEHHLDFLLERLADSERKGQKRLDSLFCVPSEDVVDEDDYPRYSKIGASLVERGLQIWDAVERAQRIKEPRSVDQVRIVQYDSCRGLEGWLVVAKDFDLFYAAKRRQWKLPPNAQLPLDERAERENAAARWSMIPITRAIDTLVVSFYDRRSAVAEAMLEIAAGMKDVVTILE